MPIDPIAHRVSSIIGNLPLAEAICESINSALHKPSVRIGGGNNVNDVFDYSLNEAIRNIEQHPQGILFRRLIEHGPHNPDEPRMRISDSKTILSDPECGVCVEFIFSHMINRFKGELAELLALKPSINLIKMLQKKKSLPVGIQLYWGDQIKERRQSRGRNQRRNLHWSGFTKGADGLIASNGIGKHKNTLAVCGVVEVKSMKRSKKKLDEQLNHHVKRLAGGVRLGNKEWSPDFVQVGIPQGSRKKTSKPLFVTVIPSSWKLSREWRSENTEHGRAFIFPEPQKPDVKDSYEKMDSKRWNIRMAWSQEALSQAAYEMTFWYMSQVGKAIYSQKALPKGWEYMTPEEAGLNAIKQMLYLLPLRFISKREKDLAIRLYNVYSFGYPLGIDSYEMLWPEDFHQSNEKDEHRH